MGIFSVNLNNINLDDTNYDKDDADTIIFVKRLAGHSKCEKSKVLKNQLNEELMLIVWHLKSWWNFCMSEDEKNGTEPIFIE